MISRIVSKDEELYENQMAVAELMGGVLVECRELVDDEGKHHVELDLTFNGAMMTIKGSQVSPICTEYTNKEFI